MTLRCITMAAAFPPCQSLVFKQEMHDLSDMLKTTIPSVFEGDDYRARSKRTLENLQKKIEKQLEKYQAELQQASHQVTILKREVEE